MSKFRDLVNKELKEFDLNAGNSSDAGLTPEQIEKKKKIIDWLDFFYTEPEDNEDYLYKFVNNYEKYLTIEERPEDDDEELDEFDDDFIATKKEEPIKEDMIKDFVIHRFAEIRDDEPFVQNVVDSVWNDSICFDIFLNKFIKLAKKQYENMKYDY